MAAPKVECSLPVPAPPGPDHSSNDITCVTRSRVLAGEISRQIELCESPHLSSLQSS